MNIHGYLERKREEIRERDADFYYTFHHLHKRLSKGGQLPPRIRINRREYEFRLLSFDEMLKNGFFPLFMIGETALSPHSSCELSDELGYKLSTVQDGLRALQWMGLLKKRGYLYALEGNRDKIFDFLKRGEIVKGKKVLRLSMCAKARKLFKEGTAIADISEKLGLSFATVKEWVYETATPQIGEKIAKRLRFQKIISEELYRELETFGLIRHDSL
jgi:hypothetical protein